VTAILGISAFYHDSAAALLVDGRLVAAAQEERFSRLKHDSGFPTRAISYCLAHAGLTPDQLDYVGFYDKPLLKFDRLIETYLAFAPRGFNAFLEALPQWSRQKLRLPGEIRKGLGDSFRKRPIFAEHHESHAAAAFFPSPFDEAAILTLDGVGEWATGSFGIGRGNRVTVTHETRFPHSLGLLYSAFTCFCGFRVNSGEYKLMGLAPYGEPKYYDLILEKLVDLKEDGSLWLDQRYFDYCHGLRMTSDSFNDLFGGKPREPETPITEREMDIAASIQRVTEEVMLRAARRAHSETGMRKLCLSGGVALNCVGNGRVLREGPFDEIWIQPAAGDAGGAIGVAYLIWHQLLGKERVPDAADSQQGSLLGPSYSDDEIASFLKSERAAHDTASDDDDLCGRAAKLIAQGKVAGWFQGRMEFGPRALGARSILGDARNDAMQTKLNMKVKFRESFRPFAPSVLVEHTEDYFDIAPARESPYMLLVSRVKNDKLLHHTETPPRSIDKLAVKRSVIPAVTHVDCSARMQTVDAARHGVYHKLLMKFNEVTGCPVVVNTSFNLSWDPIVCSPQDAYRTFMTSDIDALCMGRHILLKEKQPAFVSDEVATSPVGFLPDLWICPRCGGELYVTRGEIACRSCSAGYRIQGNIPLIFESHAGSHSPDDVTGRIKAFYEETPFPNYDEHDTLRSLIEKSRRGVYARRLDEAIPFNSNVLEVGCGTGQLSNFLGIACRRVVGTDISLSSLKLAEEFRARHDLRRVRFAQMNLFRPCFRGGAFDVVLCNGVLHHTSDPFGGLQSIASLAKPGGYVFIGLYNRYGRLMTDLRRLIFNITGGRGDSLDPRLRSERLKGGKREAWFKDQYQNPHESKHSIGQVLDWFNKCGLDFVRGIPSVAPFEDEANCGLFDPVAPGNALDHLAVQLKHVFTGSREGGFFVMIGRRRERAAGGRIPHGRT